MLPTVILDLFPLRKTLKSAFWMALKTLTESSIRDLKRAAEF